MTIILLDYKSKVITVSQALALVKTNDVIVSGLASAEPRAFLAQLHTIAERVSNVTVTTCLPMIDAEYFLNPEYRTSFNMAGWFYTAPMRKAHKNGSISFIPNHLHLASRKRLHHQKPNKIGRAHV